MESKEEIQLNNFIENQKSLLNLEKAEEVEQHYELLKTSTQTELEQAGLCLSKLVIENVKNGLYGKILYTMQASNYDKQALATNESLRARMTEKFSHHRFSPGDVVGFYEFQDNKGPDFSSKPTIQGIVYRVKEFKIIVSVNEPPEDPLFVKKMFHIIMMTNEVTYNRYLKALDKIKKVKESQEYQSEYLVRVLLQGEDPSSENPYFKRDDLKAITPKDLKFNDNSLNPDQIEAVAKAMKAQSFFLIHGPPGTGKTKTVCEFIHQCTLKKLKVLACAASNIAVDNMVERLRAKDVKCCRLGHPARLLPTVHEVCLDNLVSKDESKKDLRSNKKEINSLLKQLSKTQDREARKGIKKTISEREKEIRTLERGAVYDTLANANVILCTNTGAGDKTLQDFIEKLPGKAFDVVVIDECAQALEVSCWIPLVHGKRVVLAGDHLQLPPTIKSKEAEKKGLGVTLFDRLMRKYEQDHSQLLRTQYRMNSQIMEWSSQEVYQGKLIADESVKNHSLADLRGKKGEGDDDIPVLMLMDTAGCQMGENVSSGEGKSKFNIGEADLVRVLAKELMESYSLEPRDIGIITPYNAQVDLIRQELQKEHVFKGLECSTVDGFQGREKEVIIISMVRSNPTGNIGFLGEFRRMNVAVTRAKRFVAIICDTDTVKHDEFLKKLVEYFEKNAEVRTAKEFQTDKNVRFGEGLIAKDQITKEKPKEGNQEAQPKKKNKKKKEATKNTGTQPEAEEKKENLVPQKSRQEIEKENIEKIFRKIDEFNKDSNRTEYSLPASLEGFERKEVHSYAELLKLIHESVGEGPERHIVLRKRAVKAEKPVVVEEKKEQPATTTLKQETKPQPAPNANKEKKKKEKEKEKKAKEDEMDDMAFLDSLIEQNKHCHFMVKEGVQCQNNISTLGVVCKFCKYKFCTKHVLAETHGCGDAASVQAKSEFRNQFYKSNNMDYFKPLKQDDEDYLKKRLADKIQNQTVGRGVKKGGKDQEKKRK